MQRIFPLDRVFQELGAGGEDGVAAFRALVEGRHNWTQSEAHREMSSAGGKAAVQQGAGVHSEKWKNGEGYHKQHVDAGNVDGKAAVQQCAGIHGENENYKNGEGYTQAHVDAGKANAKRISKLDAVRHTNLLPLQTTIKCANCTKTIIAGERYKKTSSGPKKPVKHKCVEKATKSVQTTAQMHASLTGKSRAQVAELGYVTGSRKK
ncbi:hypothetical protein B484DRAFT_405442 [Ochromonadaceae sp. CCMP2298]|nr:hypothetical protein B484DRAFT_405442 [Ochromonadaceae sp. CCMP2298]